MAEETQLYVHSDVVALRGTMIEVHVETGFEFVVRAVDSNENLLVAEALWGVAANSENAAEVVAVEEADSKHEVAEGMGTEDSHRDVDKMGKVGRAVFSLLPTSATCLALPAIVASELRTLTKEQQ